MKNGDSGRIVQFRARQSDLEMEGGVQWWWWWVGEMPDIEILEGFAVTGNYKGLE